MKNRSFEVSEYGNLLMYDRKYSAADVKYMIETNQLNGLRIFDVWDPLPSLDFLRDFTFLERLEVTCDDDHDYSFLRDLPQLEHLSIGPSFPMENPIDLSHQVNLKYLSIQWRKDRIYGLEACQNLEDLCLVEFKKRDLRLISTLSKIVRLRIKTGSVKSLDGVEGLQELKELEIGNCRSLVSIGHLKGLGKLQSIKIESCHKIKDYGALSDLPLLSSLKLINCGEIPDFDYTNRFPNLLRLELLGRTKLKKLD
jgi:hypothetical protein